MKCPIDETTLQMTERQGIEIDYCPQCRGVWLDRGELDKLIDRSAVEQPAPPPGAAYERREAAYPPQRYEDRRHEGHHGKKRRRESFLGELFDF